MFIHEEKQSLKLAKWEVRALKSKLVEFDNYTIYKIYIEDQNKVIWVKDLQIFKDITSKVTTSLQYKYQIKNLTKTATLKKSQTYPNGWPRLELGEQSNHLLSQRQKIEMRKIMS